MEWSESNKLNPFNSYKGLTWYQSHYLPIARWWMGERTLPPPIEASFDCCHNCNFMCPHCNSQKHTNRGKGVMGKEELFSTFELLSGMGVRGFCFGGGGEPTMNKGLPDLLRWIWRGCRFSGAVSAVATNGFRLNKSLINEMIYCKWVAVSVDAGGPKTFKKVHGVDGFDRVIGNIKRLVDAKKMSGTDVLISYRFLMTPDNWTDLEDACRIAREIGVDAFHARPADLERKDIVWIHEGELQPELVKEALARCRDYETDMFKVITATHKFTKDFRVFHPFKNCVASPLVLQVCADGNSYVCPDHKLEERFKLCETKDIRKYWGSDDHRELLQEINVDEECSRCTWTPYAEQIEKLAFGDDPCHLNFP